MTFEKRGPKIPQTNGSPRNPGWPARKPCFWNDGSFQARFTQRPSGALSSNNERRLSAPSARSDGLDDVDGGPDCRVYTQMGGIQQVRVRGRLQGRRSSVLIAFIA